MVSSPLRAILLLSFSSPRRGTPFYRYREHARRRFVLEAVLEGSRDVALVSQCIHVLEYFPF